MSLQPDITALLVDRELGAVPFEIIRSKGNWERGRFVTQSQTIQAIGNIQPASTHDLEQLPEGDRLKGMLVIRTMETLYATTEGAPASEDAEAYSSDVLVWRGARYKVVSAMPWMDYGWCEAFATRM